MFGDYRHIASDHFRQLAHAMITLVQLFDNEEPRGMCRSLYNCRALRVVTEVGCAHNDFPPIPIIKAPSHRRC